MLMPYVSFYFPRWRDDGRVWESINLPFPFRALVKDTGMVHPTHACRTDSSFVGRGQSIPIDPLHAKFMRGLEEVCSLVSDMALR